MKLQGVHKGLVLYVVIKILFTHILIFVIMNMPLKQLYNEIVLFTCNNNRTTCVLVSQQQHVKSVLRCYGHLQPQKNRILKSLCLEEYDQSKCQTRQYLATNDEYIASKYVNLVTQIQHDSLSKYFLKFVFHNIWYFKILEYLQKTKTLKSNVFSWSEFCYSTKVRAKYVFLTK